MTRAPDAPTVPVTLARDTRSHRTTTGWWRTPHRSRRAAPDLPRHRADTIGPRPVMPAKRHHRRAVVPTPAQRRRRTTRIVAWSLGGLVTVPALAAVLGYLMLPVPNVSDAVRNQVALVSFADGSTLTHLAPGVDGPTAVPLETVPPAVLDAVLAAEDPDFPTAGVDPGGILRAARAERHEGAGITQQYVRATLDGDRTVWQAIKETLLTIKADRQRTKDQILGDYVNTAYFGRGAYGVQAAAQAYFGKNAKVLDPAEGALLAGLIQSPARWDPAGNPERAQHRWAAVLDGVVAEGRLAPSDRAALRFPPTLPRQAAGGAPADSTGHIVSAVLAELADLGITEQEIARDGLRITTTIDPRRQQEAAVALTGQPANQRAALVAIEPDSGKVLAYYGGEDGLGQDYARTNRLPGATFTPFVVLAGLLQNPPVGLGETFGSRNADLKQAMTLSDNTVFNQLAQRIGPTAVADAARAAGITAPLDGPTEPIALGAKEISPVDLASAYATIAAGGRWHQPHLVASVVAADGTVLHEAAPEGEQRFPERVARNVTETMLDVAAADGLALPDGRPVAAKTGAVESRAGGQVNDAWMAGFTPTVSTSVWMGTERDAPRTTATGAPVEAAAQPGDAWREFMADAHGDEPVQQFTPFAPVGEPPAETTPATSPATTPSLTEAPTTRADPTSRPERAAASPSPSQSSMPSPSESQSQSPTPAPTSHSETPPTPADAASQNAPTTSTTPPATDGGPECTAEEPCG